MIVVEVLLFEVCSQMCSGPDATIPLQAPDFHFPQTDRKRSWYNDENGAIAMTSSFEMLYAIRRVVLLCRHGYFLASNQKVRFLWSEKSSRETPRSTTDSAVTRFTPILRSKGYMPSTATTQARRACDLVAKSRGR